MRLGAAVSVLVAFNIAGNSNMPLANSGLSVLSPWTSLAGL
jgi:hypothetical protein